MSYCHRYAIKAFQIRIKMVIVGYMLNSGLHALTVWIRLCNLHALTMVHFYNVINTNRSADHFHFINKMTYSQQSALITLVKD